MNKNVLLRGLLALLLVSGSAQLVQAQGSGDDPTGGPLVPGDAPTAVPIDGGASLLLAGGAAFALRRLRQRKAR